MEPHPAGPPKDEHAVPSLVVRPVSPSAVAPSGPSDPHVPVTKGPTKSRPVSPFGQRTLDSVPAEARHSFLGRPSTGPSAQRLQAMSKMGKVRDFAGLSPVSLADSPAARRLDNDHPALQHVREAMCTRDAELLNTLLQEHGDIVTLRLGADNHTLLHEAVLSKSVDVVDVVLHVPTVEVGAVDAQGDSCLHWLCWYSDDRHAVEPIEILQRLLCERAPGIDVDLPDARGFTPLMFAVDQCNDSFVRVLVEHGASVTAQSATSHTCPILVAVHHGSFGIAEMLLQAGAQVMIGVMWLCVEDFVFALYWLTPILRSVGCCGRGQPVSPDAGHSTRQSGSCRLFSQVGRHGRVCNSARYSERFGAFASRDAVLGRCGILPDASQEEEAGRLSQDGCRHSLDCVTATSFPARVGFVLVFVHVVTKHARSDTRGEQGTCLVPCRLAMRRPQARPLCD